MDHTNQNPIFIGHIKRIQNDQLNNSSSSTSPYCNEIFFSSLVHITGYHIVPKNFKLDSDINPTKQINFTGKTSPDIHQRPFALQLFGKKISSSNSSTPIKLLSSSIINGGIQFLPIENSSDDKEVKKSEKDGINYILFDGDFEEISIILYGEELKEDERNKNETREEKLIRLAKSFYPSYFKLFNTPSPDSSSIPSSSIIIPSSSLTSSLDSNNSEKFFTLFYNDLLYSFSSKLIEDKNKNDNNENYDQNYEDKYKDYLQDMLKRKENNNSLDDKDKDKDNEDNLLYSFNHCLLNYYNVYDMKLFPQYENSLFLSSSCGDLISFIFSLDINNDNNDKIDEKIKIINQFTSILNKTFQSHPEAQPKDLSNISTILDDDFFYYLTEYLDRLFLFTFSLLKEISSTLLISPTNLEYFESFFFFISTLLINKSMINILLEKNYLDNIIIYINFFLYNKNVLKLSSSLTFSSLFTSFSFIFFRFLYFPSLLSFLNNFDFDSSTFSNKYFIQSYENNPNLPRKENKLSNDDKNYLSFFQYFNQIASSISSSSPSLNTITSFYSSILKLSTVISNFSSENLSSISSLSVLLNKFNSLIKDDDHKITLKNNKEILPPKKKLDYEDEEDDNDDDDEVSSSPLFSTSSNFSTLILDISNEISLGLERLETNFSSWMNKWEDVKNISKKTEQLELSSSTCSKVLSNFKTNNNYLLNFYLENLNFDLIINTVFIYSKLIEEFFSSYKSLLNKHDNELFTNLYNKILHLFYQLLLNFYFTSSSSSRSIFFDIFLYLNKNINSNKFKNLYQIESISQYFIQFFPKNIFNFDLISKNSLNGSVLSSSPNSAIPSFFASSSSSDPNSLSSNLSHTHLLERNDENSFLTLIPTSLSSFFFSSSLFSSTLLANFSYENSFSYSHLKNQYNILLFLTYFTSSFFTFYKSFSYYLSLYLEKIGSLNELYNEIKEENTHESELKFLNFINKKKGTFTLNEYYDELLNNEILKFEEKNEILTDDSLDLSEQVKTFINSYEYETISMINFILNSFLSSTSSNYLYLNDLLTEFYNESYFLVILKQVEKILLGRKRTNQIEKYYKQFFLILSNIFHLIKNYYQNKSGNHNFFQNLSFFNILFNVSSLFSISFSNSDFFASFQKEINQILSVIEDIKKLFFNNFIFFLEDKFYLLTEKKKLITGNNEESNIQEKDAEKLKDNEIRDRTRDRERERGRSRDRDRERSRDRGRSRDRDRRRSRDRDRGKSRDRERSRDRGRSRDRERGKSRERGRSRDRKDKENIRDKSKFIKIFNSTSSPFSSFNSFSLSLKKNIRDLNNNLLLFLELNHEYFNELFIKDYNKNKFISVSLENENNFFLFLEEFTSYSNLLMVLNSEKKDEKYKLKNEFYFEFLQNLVHYSNFLIFFLSFYVELQIRKKQLNEDDEEIKNLFNILLNKYNINCFYDMNLLKKLIPLYNNNKIILFFDHIISFLIINLQNLQVFINNHNYSFSSFTLILSFFNNLLLFNHIYHKKIFNFLFNYHEFSPYSLNSISNSSASNNSPSLLRSSSININYFVYSSSFAKLNTLILTNLLSIYTYNFTNSNSFSFYSLIAKENYEKVLSEMNIKDHEGNKIHTFILLYFLDIVKKTTNKYASSSILNNSSSIIPKLSSSLNSTTLDLLKNYECSLSSSYYIDASYRDTIIHFLSHVLSPAYPQYNQSFILMNKYNQACLNLSYPSLSPLKNNSQFIFNSSFFSSTFYSSSINISSSFYTMIFNKNFFKKLILNQENNYFLSNFIINIFSSYNGKKEMDEDQKDFFNYFSKSLLEILEEITNDIFSLKLKIENEKNEKLKKKLNKLKNIHKKNFIYFMKFLKNIINVSNKFLIFIICSGSSDSSFISLLLKLIENDSEDISLISFDLISIIYNQLNHMYSLITINKKEDDLFPYSSSSSFDKDLKLLINILAFSLTKLFPSLLKRFCSNNNYLIKIFFLLNKFNKIYWIQFLQFFNSSTNDGGFNLNFLLIILWKNFTNSLQKINEMNAYIKKLSVIYNEDEDTDEIDERSKKSKSGQKSSNLKDSLSNLHTLLLSSIIFFYFNIKCMKIFFSLIIYSIKSFPSTANSSFSFSLFFNMFNMNPNDLKKFFNKILRSNILTLFNLSHYFNENSISSQLKTLNVSLNSLLKMKNFNNFINYLTNYSYNLYEFNEFFSLNTAFSSSSTISPFSKVSYNLFHDLLTLFYEKSTKHLTFIISFITNPSILQSSSSSNTNLTTLFPSFPSALSDLDIHNNFFTNYLNNNKYYYSNPFINLYELNASFFSFLDYSTSISSFNLFLVNNLDDIITTSSSSTPSPNITHSISIANIPIKIEPNNNYLLDKKYINIIKKEKEEIGEKKWKNNIGSKSFHSERFNDHDSSSDSYRPSKFFRDNYHNPDNISPRESHINQFPPHINDAPHHPINIPAQVSTNISSTTPTASSRKSRFSTNDLGEPTFFEPMDQEIPTTHNDSDAPYSPTREQSYSPPRRDHTYSSTREQSYSPPRRDHIYSPTREHSYSPSRRDPTYSSTRNQTYSPTREKSYSPERNQSYSPSMDYNSAIKEDDEYDPFA